MTIEKATHLFISYAIEDVALAEWLARKLVNQGYAVWFDRMKLLGGDQELFDKAYGYIKQYY